MLQTVKPREDAAGPHALCTGLDVTACTAGVQGLSQADRWVQPSVTSSAGTQRPAWRRSSTFPHAQTLFPRHLATPLCSSPNQPAGPRQWCWIGAVGESTLFTLAGRVVFSVSEAVLLVSRCALQSSEKSTCILMFELGTPVQNLLLLSNFLSSGLVSRRISRKD